MSDQDESIVFPDHDYLNENIALSVSVTDGQRNTQEIHALPDRALTLASELAKLRADIAETRADWLVINQELAQERKARTGAQFERDALALKLQAFTALLQRVVEVDEAEDIIGRAEALRDIYAALSVAQTASSEGGNRP